MFFALGYFKVSDDAIFPSFSSNSLRYLSMASISFLGTGSGIPSADRYFTSMLVQVEGKHLLIDAGEPCVHLLRDRGDLILTIDRILITHGHVDHIGGLPALLQGAMILGRSKPLTIHLPEEMIIPIRAWIRALYLIEEELGFLLDWQSWKNGVPVNLEVGISFTPYANNHLISCYRSLSGADSTRPCNAYSLVILSGEFRAVFSGDLSAADELTPLLSDPVSVLVSELSHFTAKELAVALGGSEIHALCLVHLADEYADDRSQLQELMERLLPQVGDVMIPKEGEVLDF